MNVNTFSKLKIKTVSSALRSYMTDVLMELNRKIGATRAIHHEIQSLIETYILVRLLIWDPVPVAPCRDNRGDT